MRERQLAATLVFACLGVALVLRRPDRRTRRGRQPRRTGNQDRSWRCIRKRRRVRLQHRALRRRQYRPRRRAVRLRSPGRRLGLHDRARRGPSSRGSPCPQMRSWPDRSSRSATAWRLTHPATPPSSAAPPTRPGPGPSGSTRGPGRVGASSKRSRRRATPRAHDLSSAPRSTSRPTPAPSSCRASATYSEKGAVLGIHEVRPELGRAGEACRSRRPTRSAPQSSASSSRSPRTDIRLSGPIRTRTPELPGSTPVQARPGASNRRSRLRVTPPLRIRASDRA